MIIFYYISLLDSGRSQGGYRITGKDVITLEPKTWKTAWPIGIHPFLNKSYGKPEEKFPGYIRDYGFSVAYQRFLSKGLYAELNVMPTWQAFVNNEGHKIDNGFQIFNTLMAYPRATQTDLSTRTN